MKLKLTAWVISCGPSTRGGYHIQARTADQLSSFAVVVPNLAGVHRGKTPDGAGDVFTLSILEPHATMNVVGKIAYVGQWPTA